MTIKRIEDLEIINRLNALNHVDFRQATIQDGISADLFKFVPIEQMIDTTQVDDENIINDSLMDEPTTAAWDDAGTGATLSKVPHGAGQQLLRIASNGVVNGEARPVGGIPSLEATDAWVRIRARGDGIAYLTVFSNGLKMTFTAKQNWQEQYIKTSNLSSDMALVVNGINGHCDVDIVTAAKREFVATTDSLYQATTVSNLVKNPNRLDLSPWVLGAVDSINQGGAGQTKAGGFFQGIIGDIGTGAHLVSQDFVLTEGLYTTRVFAFPGNLEWIRIQIFNGAATVAAIKVNLLTGADGVYEGTPLYVSKRRQGDGSFLLSMSFLATDDVYSFRIFPAETNVNNNYTGDDETVNLWVGDVQIVKGFPDENKEFVDGGALSVPDTFEFLRKPFLEAKKNAGLWQLATALTPFDGWEYPRDGRQYKSDAGNFKEIFTGFMPGGPTLTLTPVGSRLEYMKPFAISVLEGLVKDSAGDNSSLLIPSNISANHFCGIESFPNFENQKGTFLFSVGTAHQAVTNQYYIEIEYLYLFSELQDS